MRLNRLPADGFFFATGGQDGGNGGLEMPGIDFIHGQRAINGIVQPAGIIATAGANGFEGGHPQAVHKEIAGEQGGQNRFAGPGVGAGDEPDFHRGAKVTEMAGHGDGVYGGLILPGFMRT